MVGHGWIYGSPHHQHHRWPSSSRPRIIVAMKVHVSANMQMVVKDFNDFGSPDTCKLLLLSTPLELPSHGLRPCPCLWWLRQVFKAVSALVEEFSFRVYKRHLGLLCRSDDINAIAFSRAAKLPLFATFFINIVIPKRRSPVRRHYGADRSSTVSAFLHFHCCNRMKSWVPRRRSRMETCEVKNGSWTVLLR